LCSFHGLLTRMPMRKTTKLAVQLCRYPARERSRSFEKEHRYFDVASLMGQLGISAQDQA
jgi:hypothetical protein